MGPASAVRPQMRPAARTGAVLTYIALALLALVPGLMLKFDISVAGTIAGEPLAWLRQTLSDIRFGYGLRFWLGVTGATLMVLLLLYPVRKLFAKGRTLGSVGGWFHMHMLFGLGGPVLVLYHCNFSLGGLNANVALWAMLMVAISGIIGHFVYSSVSAEFYWGKQKAREQLDAIAATLGQLDAMHPSRWQLIDELEAFEAELLTPRKGIIASIAARWGVEKRRRHFLRATGWHLGQCAEQLHLSAGEHDRLRAIVGKHLNTYVRIARHTSTRSVREQLWARWRMFHLPVFIVMVVAVVLHIVAVWGMDGPEDQQTAAGAQSTSPATAIGTPLAAKRVATQRIDSSPGSSRQASAANGASATQPATAETVKPAALPKPLVRKAAAPAPVAAPPADSPAMPPQPLRDASAAAPKPVPPKLVAVAPAPQPPVPPQPPQAIAAPTAPDEIKAAKAELKRFVEQPMALGAPKPGMPAGADPNTLTAQIIAFKAKRDAKQFSHSEIETGFALTGKHLKADCADCHKSPMRESRVGQPASAPQQQCLDCHAKDDTHNGRRPDCAKCHTTNRWTQILRRN